MSTKSDEVSKTTVGIVSFFVGCVLSAAYFKPIYTDDYQRGYHDGYGLAYEDYHKDLQELISTLGSQRNGVVTGTTGGTATSP